MGQFLPGMDGIPIPIVTQYLADILCRLTNPAGFLGDVQVVLQSPFFAGLDLPALSLIEMLMSGVPPAEVQDEMIPNPPRREELKAKLAAADAPPPLLHPEMAEPPEGDDSRAGFRAGFWMLAVERVEGADSRNSARWGGHFIVTKRIAAALGIAGLTGCSALPLCPPRDTTTPWLPPTGTWRQSPKYSQVQLSERALR